MRIAILPFKSVMALAVV